MQAVHQREIVRAEKIRHQVIFLHTHAVLAGNRAAHVDAGANNLRAGGNGAAELVAVASVERDQRMQVAISRVKNVADLESVFLADFFQAAQRFRQLGARNHAIHRVIGWRNAAHRAKGVFAAFPQQIALGGVARYAHLHGVVQAANVRHFSRVGFHFLAQAVDIDEQRAPRLRSGSPRARILPPREWSSYRTFHTQRE